MIAFGNCSNLFIAILPESANPEVVLVKWEPHTKDGFRLDRDASIEIVGGEQFATRTYPYATTC